MLGYDTDDLTDRCLAGRVNNCETGFEASVQAAIESVTKATLYRNTSCISSKGGRNGLDLEDAIADDESEVDDEWEDSDDANIAKRIEDDAEHDEDVTILLEGNQPTAVCCFG